MFHKLILIRGNPDAGLNILQVKYKKHKRRDETKVSKECVARILSSLDNQLKTEPVKPRPSQRSVFRIPGVPSTRPVPSVSQCGLDSNPMAVDVDQTQGLAYNTSSMQRTWLNSKSQYYVNGHSDPPNSVMATGKGDMNKDHDHLNYSGQSCSLPNSYYGQSFNHSLTNGSRPLEVCQPYRDPCKDMTEINNMDFNRIYGYNQTNKYSIHEPHDVKSEFGAEDSHHGLANSQLHMQCQEFGTTQKQNNCGSSVSPECSRNAHLEHPPKVDPHAILRQKLTVPDDADVLTPVSFSSAQSSHSFQTPKASSQEGFTSQLVADLVACDDALDLTDLYNMTSVLSKDSKSVTMLLCELGDKVVGKLVQWTKKLPFFNEIPIEVHSRLLTSKWHELLLLITTAYKVIQGQKPVVMSQEELFNFYMRKLQVNVH